MQSFDEHLESIRISISSIDTHMWACITPKEKLVINLRWVYKTNMSVIFFSEKYENNVVTVESSET